MGDVDANSRPETYGHSTARRRSLSQGSLGPPAERLSPRDHLQHLDLTSPRVFDSSHFGKNADSEDSDSEEWHDNGFGTSSHKMQKRALARLSGASKRNSNISLRSSGSRRGSTRSSIGMDMRRLPSNGAALLNENDELHDQLRQTQDELECLRLKVRELEESALQADPHLARSKSDLETIPEVAKGRKSNHLNKDLMNRVLRMNKDIQEQEEFQVKTQTKMLDLDEHKRKAETNLKKVELAWELAKEDAATVRQELSQANLKIVEMRCTEEELRTSMDMERERKQIELNNVKDELHALTADVFNGPGDAMGQSSSLMTAKSSLADELNGLSDNGSEDVEDEEDSRSTGLNDVSALEAEIKELQLQVQVARTRQKEAQEHAVRAKAEVEKLKKAQAAGQAGQNTTQQPGDERAAMLRLEAELNKSKELVTELEASREKSSAPLVTELKDAQTEISRLEEGLHAQEAARERAQKDAQTEISRLEEGLHAQEAAREREAGFNQTASELEQSRLDLAHAEKISAEHLASLRAREELIESLQSTANEEAIRLGRLWLQKKQDEESQAARGEATSSSKDECEEWRQKAGAAKAEVQEAAEHIQKLREELATASDTSRSVDSPKRERSGLWGRVEELQGELAQARLEEQKATSRAMELQGQMSDTATHQVQKELADGRKAQEQLRQELAQAKEEEQKALKQAQEAAELRNELVSTRSERDAATADVARLRQAHEGAEQQGAQELADGRKAQEQLRQDLAQAIEEEQKALKRAQEAAELRTELESTRSELETATVDVARLRQAHEGTVRRSLLQQGAQAAQAQEERQYMQEQVQALTQREAQFLNDIDAWEASDLEHRSTKANLEERLRDAHGEAVQLRGKLQEAECQQNRSLVERRALEDAQEQLTGEVHRLQELKDARGAELTAMAGVREELECKLLRFESTEQESQAGAENLIPSEREKWQAEVDDMRAQLSKHEDEQLKIRTLQRQLAIAKKLAAQCSAQASTPFWKQLGFWCTTAERSPEANPLSEELSLEGGGETSSSCAEPVRLEGAGAASSNGT